MLCVKMNSQGVPSHNEKNSSPNPLNCPPGLLLNQQAQAFTNNQLQVDLSNPSGLVFNNDFMQQPNNTRQISSGSVSRQTSQGSITSNQAGGNMVASTNNLQEQIVASLASQLMSRRQMMMNYDLSGNGNLFHPGVSNGSNQGLMSRLTDAKVNQHGQTNGGRYQQASLNRVPCQARGMATDHNALTAFLEIPDDAIHGLHLMCSHATCRSAGVKFRYCYYCKKPVTKQNFRSRHLHADLAEKAKDVAAESCKRQIVAPINNQGAPVETTAAGNLSALTTVPLPRLPATGTTFTAQQSLGQPNLNKGQTLDGSMNSKSVIPNMPLLGAISTNLDSKVDSEESRGSPFPQESSGATRSLIWACVLEERPTDLSLLPVWIAKVISVSDPVNSIAGYRIPEDKLASRQRTPTQRESDWNSLLWERPKGNQDDEKVTAWLVKVLERSSQGYLGESTGTGTGFTPLSNYSKCSYDAQMQYFASGGNGEATESRSSPIQFVQTNLHTYDDTAMHASKKRKV